jgi:DNA-binding CsgD family transcriptional regulator
MLSRDDHDALVARLYASALGDEPWLGTLQCISGLFGTGGALSLPGGVSAWLTLLSTETECHASEAAIASYRRLAPHIAQALSLGQVLQQRAATQDLLLNAPAHRADGVILIGHSGAPTVMNDTARAILSSDDGLFFSRGRFVTGRAAETRRLQRMIGDAIAHVPPLESRPSGEMLITRPSGKRPYMLRVMRGPRSERFLAGASPACVVHLHDLATVLLPSRRLLGAAFGLSEREIDLVIELVRCVSLPAAAGNAGMALNTARNHLQRIFRKSGTASQAELIQLFTRIA